MDTVSYNNPVTKTM